MQQSQVDFLLKHLFDEGYKDRVLQAIRSNGLAVCRTKWTYKKNHPLLPVPNRLYCGTEDTETIWVLFRTHNDIELKSAVPLNASEEESDIVVEFEKMPVGIQRAIAISLPASNKEVHWEIFSSSVGEQTSIHYLSGMKTFTKERVRADKLSRTSRERIKAKRLGPI